MHALNTAVSSEDPYGHTYLDGSWDDSCPMELARQLMIGNLGISEAAFDRTGDRCYCKQCLSPGDDTLFSHGRPSALYASPVPTPGLEPWTSCLPRSCYSRR